VSEQRSLLLRGQAQTASAGDLLYGAKAAGCDRVHLAGTEAPVTADPA
jgi:hypothetical protein